LILRITKNYPTRNITSANRFIMETNRAAIADIFPQSAVRNPQSAISVRGHTDLCLGDLKFAGNSQRRRKHFLLFHGTLLLNCNLTRISELLLMPALQPDYRASRSHSDFVTNLNLTAENVKAALAEEWNANEDLLHPPLDEIAQLARKKYSTHEWNFKF
jgi:lipoate-protein ligase A